MTRAATGKSSRNCTRRNSSAGNREGSRCSKTGVRTPAVGAIIECPALFAARRPARVRQPANSTRAVVLQSTVGDMSVLLVVVNLRLKSSVRRRPRDREAYFTLVLGAWPNQ